MWSLDRLIDCKTLQTFLELLTIVYRHHVFCIIMFYHVVCQDRHERSDRSNDGPGPSATEPGWVQLDWHGSEVLRGWKESASLQTRVRVFLQPCKHIFKFYIPIAQIAQGLIDLLAVCVRWTHVAWHTSNPSNERRTMIQAPIKPFRLVEVPKLKSEKSGPYLHSFQDMCWLRFCLVPVCTSHEGLARVKDVKGAFETCVKPMNSGLPIFTWMVLCTLLNMLWKQVSGHTQKEKKCVPHCNSIHCPYWHLLTSFDHCVQHCATLCNSGSVEVCFGTRRGGLSLGEGWNRDSGQELGTNATNGAWMGAWCTDYLHTIVVKTLWKHGESMATIDKLIRTIAEVIVRLNWDFSPKRRGGNHCHHTICSLRFHSILAILMTQIWLRLFAIMELPDLKWKKNSSVPLEIADWARHDQKMSKMSKNGFSLAYYVSRPQ